MLMSSAAVVSSEAMLGGQRSQYKLLVRAVNQHTGIEAPFITSAVSEDFVVCSLYCCLCGSCKIGLASAGSALLNAV